MEGMKKIAAHIGAMDIPRSDEGNRHIHKNATPKLGAVGIFLAFLISLLKYIPMLLDKLTKKPQETPVAKPAVVETGATVYVPLFVEIGDKIKIDTRTGEYLSRV